MNRRHALKTLGAISLPSLAVIKPIKAKSPPFKPIERFNEGDTLSLQRMNELVDAINELKKLEI